jgi:hypothetical protein
LDSEFENWFGDLFSTLCIRDLEMINEDTTVLVLFVGMVGFEYVSRLIADHGTDGRARPP